MTILTEKMNFARAISGHDYCKLWLPCNEASGSVLTDKITGNTVTLGGSTAFTVAHSVTALSTGSGDTFTVPAIAPGSAFCLFMVNKYVTTALFQAVILGDNGAGEKNLQIGGTQFSYDNGSSSVNTAATTTSQGVNDVTMLAGVYDGADETAFYYATDIGDTFTKGNTGDVSSAKTAFNAASFTNEITLHSTSAQHTYGVGLFVFADGLPSDFTTGMEWVHQNWGNGHNALYPGWSALT